MSSRTIYRVLAGVITITLVSSVGRWLLSYIPKGFAKFYFAIVFGILIPALVLPRLLNIRFDAQYSRTILTLLITFGIVMGILQSLVPPDPLISIYADIAAVVVALLVTYFVVVYDIDKYLLKMSE